MRNTRYLSPDAPLPMEGITDVPLSHAAPYAGSLPDLHKAFSKLLIFVSSLRSPADLQDKLSKRDKEVSSLVSQTETLRAQVSGKFP